ncbi:DUF6894 family protein [Roseomonas sp. WA12]
MPRYFFHVHDVQSSPDTEGIDLPSVTAAQVEAVRFSGEVLRGSAETFWNAGQWTLEVTDSAGLTLFILQVLATEAPVSRMTVRTK